MTMNAVRPVPVDASGATVAGDATHAAVFHALAEPTRLALLAHLASGEHRVRDLVDHMHLAQSTVSKHLACLRDCGLLTVRSEGRASWFAIADPAALDALMARADALVAAAGAGALGGHDREHGGESRSGDDGHGRGKGRGDRGMLRRADREAAS